MAKRQVTFLIRANAKQFSKALNSAQYKLKAFGRKTERLGRSLTSFTAPLAIAGAASVKMASDFQASMTKIQTLVGLSRESVQGMQSDVLSLSKQTGRGPRELADALFTVASAGLRGEQAMNTLERAAKASAIGLGETGDVARALTGILQSYSKQGLTAAAATDTLIGVVREGNLEAAELAPVLGRVTGVASQLGISFDQVGASIASFTRLGVSSEEAVTGLRGIMNALLKQTPKAEAALDSVGLTFETLTSKIQKQGLAKALVDLVDRFKDNQKGLAAFAGRVRGLAAIMGTAGAQSESYLKVANSIADSTDNLNKGFATVSKTVQFKFQKAFANLKVEAVKLGTVLFPMAEKLINYISDWVKWFGSLSDETKKNIFWWTKWGLIVGGSLIVIGKLSIGISGIIGLISTLSGAIPALIGAFQGLSVAATIAAEQGLAAAITSLTALEGLVAVTGIGAIAIAIGAIGYKAYESYTSIQKLEEGMKNIIDQDVNTQSWKALETRVGRIKSKIADIHQLNANSSSGFGGAGQLSNLKKLQKELAKTKKALEDARPKGIFQTPLQQFENMGLGINNLFKKPEAPSLIIKPKITIEPEVEGGVLTELQKKVQGIMKGVQTELNKISKFAKFPEIFGDVRESKLSALKNAMQELRDAGVSPLSMAFQRLKGVYDSFKTSIGKAHIATVGVSTNIDTSGLEKLKATLQDTRTVTEKALGYTQSRFKEFSDKLSSDIGPVIARGLFNIGTAFLENAVAALTAGTAFKDVGISFLSSLADLAIRVGKIAIAVGAGIEGIRLSLASLNPVVAIAAGAALIALGAAAKGALKAAGSSPATGVSSSGGSLSGTSSSPTLSNRDSTRVFLSNISNNSQAAFQRAMERALSNAQWRVSGGDLQLVLNNSSSTYR